MKPASIVIFVLQLASIFAEFPPLLIEKAGKRLGVDAWKIDKSLSDLPQYVPVMGTKPSFSSKNTYIVLLTTKLEDRMGWSIHLWIGRLTTLESIDLTIKYAAELGERFPDESYYIEIDEHESPLFKATLPSVCETAPETEKDDASELYLVKGEKNIRVLQVPLDPAVLNKHDCFLLDAGHQFDIFTFCGQHSNDRERKYVQKLANKMLEKQHNGPKGQVKKIDHCCMDPASPGSSYVTDFFEGFATSKINFGTDEEFENSQNTNIELLQVSTNRDGTIKMEKVPVDLKSFKNEGIPGVDDKTSPGYIPDLVH